MNTVRAAGRLARALLLLTLLAALTAGLPFGLWHFFGGPLPDRFPTYDQVKAWLDQTTLFPDQTAIQILVVATWVLWALFTVQIAVQLPRAVVDTVAALRSRTALPAAAHANLAGRLLSTVAISIIAARGSLATASASTGAGSGHFPPAITAAETTNPQVHVIAAGECLWDIAAHRLGDGALWHQIYDLNAHRIQADGRALTEPDVIQPGWVLTLPANASTAALPQASGPSPVSSRATPRPAQAPTPAAVSQPAVPPPSTPTVPASPAAVSSHQAPLLARRPVAIDLPTGGYVSLTLGAGLAAALAAARIRSRINTRRRNPGEPDPPIERLTEPEATLLKAATMLGHGRFNDDSDPYVDHPSDPTAPAVPRALASLRAPVAVYLGNREGRPISLTTAATGGLGLIGDGAHDTARALLMSALAAGGFLANEAVYTVVTTTDDLHALTGHRLAGAVTDRLIVGETLGDALAVRSAVHAKLLLLASVPSASEITGTGLEQSEFVLLDCPEARTVATIDAFGTIAADGDAAPVLDGADAYRLSRDEAHSLLDRLLAAAPAAEPTPVDEPSDSPKHMLPQQAEAFDNHPTSATHDRQPEPPHPMANAPVPHQASGTTPAVPEAALTINILGPLQVTAAGRDVTDLFRPMTAAILIQLALSQRGITRTALASDLWPDPNLDPATRAKRFKATLSHTRAALAQAHGHKADHIIETRPARLLTLNPALVSVDAWRFEQLLQAPRPARLESLLETISLHRGQLAYGHEHADDRADDEAWLAPHREAYFHKLIETHVEAATLLRTTDPDHAIAILERACELEPWNNTLTEQIIEIHIENGQHHAATRRYGLLTEHLALLGMKPSARIEKLMKPVLTG